MEEKATQLRDEAVKKLSSRGFFQMLFGINKIDQAIEYYQRSGNLFKLAKNWREAATVFSEAAELNCKKGDHYEAATNLINAANCCKKYNVEAAIKHLLRAIDIYINMGKFNSAAKYHELIGELYETEECNMEKAMDHYEQASEYYRSEDNYSGEKKCLVKIAEHSALIDNHIKAIAIFQQVANYELSNTLLKYSAKDHFFQAIICQLCYDSSYVLRLLEKCVQSSPSFQDSREYQLVHCLYNCVQKKDLDEFEAALQKFDSISRLSPWHVSMLLKVKSIIKEEIDLK